MAHSHLVVEGLDYAVDEFMLQQYFKQYGTIQYVDVSTCMLKIAACNVYFLFSSLLGEI